MNPTTVSPTTADVNTISAYYGLPTATINARVSGINTKNGVGLTDDEKLILALLLLWIDCETTCQTGGSGTGV